MSNVWTVLLVVAAHAALLWLVYEKLTRALQDLRREIRRHSDNTIMQLESLMSVHAEIQPMHLLPRSRDWAASPDFLAVLIGLAHRRRPEIVVECSSGYSTLVLAATLRNLGKGRVMSLEHEPEYARKTREMLELHGLTDWATVIDAPLVPLSIDDWSGRWYDTSGLPQTKIIDMLVIDGPPSGTGALARYPAVPHLYARLNADAVIVLDDADRVDETRAAAQWTSQHPGLQILSTLPCEKGCLTLQKKDGDAL